MQDVQKEKESLSIGTGRRAFLKAASIGAVASAIAVACKKKDDDTSTPASNGVSLGSGDTSVLNYAYALEQLEAAFYTSVVTNASFTSIFTADEQAVLSDIHAHEVAHRAFFKAALGTSAIPDLTVDFSSINFADKASILNHAMAFEDLGVSAYNGAGKAIMTPAYLVLAGKIVSVEARHASVIRDLLSPKSESFAGDDVVKTGGLDGALTPTQVFASAGVYITTKIDTTTLPKV